jgi:hypothetical protein
METLESVCLSFLAEQITIFCCLAILVAREGFDHTGSIGVILRVSP